MQDGRSVSLLLLLLTTMTMAAYAQTTVTAASCQETAVSAVINGPTHTAVNGDVIQIPSGTCTWTSSLSVPSNIGITIIGAGTPNSTPSQFGAATLTTIIIDNAGSSNPMIAVYPKYGNSTMRISMLDIEPESSSTALYSPLSLSGTCTSSGCPNVRIDNIGLGLTTQWTEAGAGDQGASMIRADNVFGVFDHNTQPSGSQVWFANINHSAYLGVGGYGDNSWAQPDSFGTASNVFLENNIVYTNASVVDAEFAPEGGGVGGGRYVGRFNQINANTGFFAAFSFHGLDTDGRPQGGRHFEAYGNTINCAGGSCGDGVAGFRSGTGIVFGNTLKANYSATGGFYNNIVNISVYRIVYNQGTPWGACGGSSPYDTNDGVTYYTGTVTSSGQTTFTDSTKSWTTNQFIPTGAPYSVYDTTQGFWSEITGNTSNTATIAGPISESGWTGLNNGDSYKILRATVCADQGGRGKGGYDSGSNASPSGALNQALDPIYEWDDSGSDITNGNFSTNTGRTIANRDWYTDNSNGSPQAQTSATSPFNGTSGVGFGTLARRPTTCTTGVGYYATDQGSWNTSGNGFGSGILYQCSSANTWTSYYTPYTYPHPLTTGASGATPPAPKNLAATVQ